MLLAKGRQTSKHKVTTRCQCSFVFEICFASDQTLVFFENNDITEASLETSPQTLKLERMQNISKSIISERKTEIDENLVQHASINFCSLPLAGRSLGFGQECHRDVEPLLKSLKAQGSDQSQLPHPGPAIISEAVPAVSHWLMSSLSYYCHFSNIVFCISFSS